MARTEKVPIPHGENLASVNIIQFSRLRDSELSIGTVVEGISTIEGFDPEMDDGENPRAGYNKSALDIYYDQIRHSAKKLTPEQQIECARICEAKKLEISELEKSDLSEAEKQQSIQQCNAIIQENHNYMTESCLEWVCILARRKIGRGLDLEDLIQEGNLGLYRAVNKFDPEKGFTLTTYATWGIRQAMDRAIADQSRTIRLPVHITEKLSQLLKVEERLGHELGRTPTIEETVKAMGLPEEELIGLRRAYKQVVSLDMEVGEEDDDTLESITEDKDTVPPLDIIIQEDEYKQVRAGMDKLTPEQRKILTLRYWGNGDKPLPFEKVCVELGVSRETVRQTGKKALEKLKHYEGLD